jgi:ComF family protein
VIAPPFRALSDPLVSLLLPTACRICQQPIETLSRVPVCETCWTSVRPYEGTECAQCGLFLAQTALLHGTTLCGICRRGAFAFEQARSFAWYDGVLRELIQRFKYSGFRPLARPLANYLGQALLRMDSNSFDLVLAVPLHRRRERERGFNQAALLAAGVSRLAGIALGNKDCVRVRDTRPQTGLRGAERRRNVAGAFAVPRPERVRGRRLLLIDDVMTTGATANACAGALKSAGAGGVWVLTLGRARAAWPNVL